MRIDKFLWYSRIYKSRTIASNACKKGHIKIDLNSIKPSYEVFPNTIIYVKKNQILNQFKIIDLPTSRVGAKIVDIYLLNITSKIELEKKETLSNNKTSFKFKGKPSKKERRDIQDYLNE
ncbi:MAG: S4 domain-containing protein [Bacteroidetes bacterium]|jgi:ribosome-associated heat shock protein Hsp15|nr:S4 domain-containing protein [Bacteroidota bacterium]MDA1019388.1 S4 domain-containing protein [Bacteroidota bacterium]|tara:strand:- start:1209 stop:1568 length:360 start_codon:yes stop_codon:yes gene_type:complete